MAQEDDVISITNSDIEPKAMANVVKDTHPNNKIEENDPDKPKLLAAVAARKNAYYAKAHELLKDILTRRPLWVPAKREFAILLMASENFIEAEKFLARDAKQDPEDDWTWFSLAKVRSLLKDSQGELIALKKCTDLRFNEVLLRRLFELYRDNKDYAKALEVLARLRAHKDTLELEVAHARLLHALNRKDEALELCDKLLKKTPLPPLVVNLWLSIHLGESNEPQAVLDKLLPLIEGGQKEAFLYAAVSRAYHRMDRDKDALKFINQAIKLDGKQAHFWYDLALIQRQIGQIDESQVSLMNALNLEPMNPSTLRVHGAEHKYEYGDEPMQKLNFAHANAQLYKDDKKVELYYALGKAFEDLGELKTAFKHYEAGGSLQTRLTPYRHAGALSVLKMTRDRVKQATYENFKPARCFSDKPIFVLGMPRSGTTLSEQIIATHPEAFGAGELKLLHRVLNGISINGRVIETNLDHGNQPTYIPNVDLNNTRKMDFKDRGELYVKAIEAIVSHAGRKNIKKVVDKMPGNYFWTGVIPFVLPNAKIVHTQRHPLDNCLSTYRIFFPDGMPWSYNLTNLGKVYRAYYEHMTYWESSLPPDMMLTVNYEIMVADFENQARRVIEHVGLEWDEACLKFYENERNVKTASLNQVRKPIYNSSVGRWKKYEPYLQPLIKELGPLIQEYEGKIEEKFKLLK
jgi:tetratricopeptide (TPR) repeat protein